MKSGARNFSRYPQKLSCYSEDNLVSISESVIDEYKSIRIFILSVEVASAEKVAFSLNIA